MGLQDEPSSVKTTHWLTKKTTQWLTGAVSSWNYKGWQWSTINTKTRYRESNLRTGDHSRASFRADIRLGSPSILGIEKNRLRNGRLEEKTTQFLETPAALQDRRNIVIYKHAWDKPGVGRILGRY